MSKTPRRLHEFFWKTLTKYITYRSEFLNMINSPLTRNAYVWHRLAEYELGKLDGSVDFDIEEYDTYVTEVCKQTGENIKFFYKDFGNQLYTYCKKNIKKIKKQWEININGCQSNVGMVFINKNNDISKFLNHVEAITFDRGGLYTQDAIKQALTDYLMSNIFVLSNTIEARIEV